METAITNQLFAKDGKEMVLIPGGEFIMGSEGGYREEKPLHRVEVKGFYMDKHLTTNREYKIFCDERGKLYPEDPGWKEMPGYFINYPDHPVINVSCQLAEEYARWAGKRLPAEEEWEYAACGGLVQPMYPWGDNHPEGNRANYADKNSDFAWRDFHYSTGCKYTSPVGIYPPNGYGLCDMAGNVWQWCEDWFFKYDDTIRDTEAFQDGWGGSRVCRGGCYHSSIFDLRVARRRQVLGGQGMISVGFRCVKDVEEVHMSVSLFAEAVDQGSWRVKLKDASARLMDDMELCLGVGMLTRESAQHIRNIGFTSIEQYVTWETIENGGEDCWDFSRWDEQVEIMKEAGLKWVPFLIAGPAYSLPRWYRESRDFEGLCCLEHNIETKIQSIWDKNFYKYIERYVSKFAEHYQGSGVIEAPLLGITGDFGEAIFPVWHGNWPTQIPGLYHSHAGYWCNDRFAQADFREKLEIKYKEIEILNSLWGTRYHSFLEVKMPELAVDPMEGFRVDEYTSQGIFPLKDISARRQWIDFVDWYRSSMTEYADYWMGVTRKYFPEHPVYLCTGGDAVSHHGSDFAQQCKLAAKHRGGVRITNEASQYAINFYVTNWVASAGNFYNSYFSFEPAGKVTEKGVVCRIYNATVTGAKGLHFYESNLFDRENKMDVFLENLKYLYTGKAIKDTGAMYADISVLAGNISTADMQESFQLLRDYTDFKFLDDVTIGDGILDTVRVVVICCGEIWRKKTLDALLAWVEKGGKLIAYNIRDLRSAEEDQSHMEILFDTNSRVKSLGKGKSLWIPVEVALRKYDSGVISGTKPTKAVFEESTVFYQTRIFNVITDFLTNEEFPVTDGILDNVYTALLENRVVLLNTGNDKVQKEIILPNGSKINTLLDYNSIREIEY
jgi:formylglycine-generating enzyme